MFALLPLLLWLLLVQVIGVEGHSGAAEASREFLFFSLAMCTLALSELRNADAEMRSRDWYETLCALSIVIIAWSAAMYGVFLSVHTKPKALARLFVFSVIAAVMGFGTGTWTQIFIQGGVRHVRNGR